MKPALRTLARVLADLTIVLLHLLVLLGHVFSLATIPGFSDIGIVYTFVVCIVWLILSVGVHDAILCNYNYKRELSRGESGLYDAILALPPLAVVMCVKWWLDSYLGRIYKEEALKEKNKTAPESGAITGV